ncbi:internal scaffolding protein [Blackfly microvirus SF02]|uniref:Internal scaffolding protein n=1 Tax=Blackfly microvirus SF02 TaxID=2576452 RepID=A0A4P8PKL9_9VIRU|nr:internal scaffolding protein [Blackfly microvirus SF02]
MLKPNIHGSLDLIDDETGEILETGVFKTPFNHNTNVESDRVSLKCEDKSLAIQSAKDECDINVILERFMKSGQPPPFALPEHFGDYSQVHNQFEARSKIAEANAIFYKLDADTRTEFQNDPARWEETVLAALARGDAERLQAIGIDIQAAPVPPVPEPPKTATEAVKTPPTGG